MMSKEKVRICKGCGEVLQYTNPKQKGYMPEEVYKRGTVDLCRRCFRLQHYNDDNADFMPSDNLTKILYDATKKKAIFAYIIDLFNFEATFDREINDIIKGSKVILLANKRDILCKSFNNDVIKEYVIRRAKEAGLDPVDVIIMSAKKNYNIDEVYNSFVHYAKNKDIYVIGAASSGKSTFINKFLKNYKNDTERVITVSCYPGTTSRLIEIPLTDKNSIYDTPGIDSKSSMICNVEKEVIKHIIPKLEIKPITYQLNKGNMLLFGNLARIEYIDGPRTGVTVYVARTVDVHRAKIDNLETIKKNLIDKEKIKPISKEIDGYKMTRIKETKDTKQDIIIAGLCWISYKGNGQVFKVYTPKDVKVTHDDAKFQR